MRGGGVFKAAVAFAVGIVVGCLGLAPSLAGSADSRVAGLSTPTRAGGGEGRVADLLVLPGDLLHERGGDHRLGRVEVGLLVRVLRRRRVPVADRLDDADEGANHDEGDHDQEDDRQRPLNHRVAHDRLGLLDLGRVGERAQLGDRLAMLLEVAHERVGGEDLLPRGREGDGRVEDQRDRRDPHPLRVALAHHHDGDH